ncbi:MAG: hypothetical protein IJ806_07335 [Ruminococcus sp.]|nr:hypothetical protein [Ruminococcus sp.]
MRQRSKSRQGAALLAALVMSVMMSIIIAAALALVNHTRIRTNKEYRQKQAYFMASSCLEGFISHYEKDVYKEETALANAGKWDELATMAENNVKELQAIAAGDNTVKVAISSNGKPLYDKYDEYGNLEEKGITRRSLGDCNISVYAEGTNKMRVVSTANYLGEVRTVVAYLKYTQPTAQSKLNNALEFAGTSPDAALNINNLNVVGQTESSNSKSSSANVVYELGSSNNPYFSGAMTINGSLYTANHFELKNNLNYDAEAARAAREANQDYDEPAGCNLTVTRSMRIDNNCVKLYPDLVNKDKSYAYNDINYLNVGEALIACGASGTAFGYDDDHQVDIYASLICFGTPEGIDSDRWDSIKEAMASGNSSYKAEMTKDGGTNPSTLYGNIYTFEGTGEFNGDILIRNQGMPDIHGDIYCDGKIIIETGYEGAKDVFSTWIERGNKIYLHNPPTTVADVQNYNCDFCYTNSNANGNIQALINAGVFQELPSTWDASKNTGRQQRPAISASSKSTRPYAYYPEDLLLRDGVSTIKDTYMDMYKKDGDGNYVLVDGYEVVDVKKFTVDGGSGACTYDESTKDAKYRYFNDPEYWAVPGVLSGDASKKEFTDPKTNEKVSIDYYITESCVFGGDPISNRDNQFVNILIDLDAADKDIVVLMESGTGATPSNTYYGKFNILVNGDDEGKHFVYFVTDSGIGDLYDDYDPNDEDNWKGRKGYKYYEYEDENGEHDSSDTTFKTTFKRPTFYFDSSNQISIVDLACYCASESGKKVNFTYKNMDDTVNYNAGKGNIIFLCTQGSTFGLANDNECLIQGTIYAPEATIKLGKGNETLSMVDEITSKLNVNGNSNATVIGACICGKIDTNANNNTIIYQEVNDQSMLSKVKGGKNKLTASFRVINYANY